VGFEVLAAAVLNSSILLDITPHSPLKVNRHFGRICNLHLHGRRKSHSQVCLLPAFALVYSLAYSSTPKIDMFLRNVGSRSREYTDIYRRRQNSPVLISACTHTTQGTSTLNMTNDVTVAAESELLTHTQHAGSRGKVSRLCSGGSRLESRQEHRLHSLKPFGISLSPYRNVVGIATVTGWTTQSSGFEFR
jgi:hypothetical protein